MDVLEGFFLVAAVVLGIATVLLAAAVLVLSICFVLSGGAWPVGFAEVL